MTPLRIMLVMLLLVPAAFPQYSSPPLVDVHNYNRQAGQGLEGRYDPGTAFNRTIQLTFGSYSQAVVAAASTDIAGLSLMVDNATCPRHDLSAIVARGSSMGGLVSLPSEGYPNFVCDREWFGLISDETAWRCDFDNDYCAEYVNRSFVSYDRVSVVFTFRNISAAEDFEHNVVEVPEEVLEEMRDSSGAENLTVSVSGPLVFSYELNDRSFGYGDCGSNYRYVNETVEINVTRSFRVFGENRLFFLRAPVLREQWSRNNRFDVIVLSQSPLYSAEVALNGGPARNITIRGFATADGGYGLRTISSDYSNASPRTGWSEYRTAGMTPAQLESSPHPFAYVYEFNSTYHGTGAASLLLTVNDSCSGRGAYEETVTSRMLSRNGTMMENGSPFSASLARPSLAAQERMLSRTDVGLGLVALVVLLSFVNFWLLK